MLKVFISKTDKVNNKKLFKVTYMKVLLHLNFKYNFFVGAICKVEDESKQYNIEGEKRQVA